MNYQQAISNASAYYNFLYAEVNIVCILMIVQIFFQNRNVLDPKYRREFSGVCIASSISFFSDTMCVLMMGREIPFYRPLFYLFKDLYFFSLVIVCFCWYLFVGNQINNRFIRKPKKILRHSILVWAAAFLLVFNWFVPVCFEFRDGTYRRGTLFTALYVLEYAYVLLSLIATVRAVRSEDKYAERDTLRSYIAFPLAPAVAGIVQFVAPSIPILCCCLALVLQYITNKNTSAAISLDPLTQLNNRGYFLKKLQRVIENDDGKRGIYTVLMDVDYFKGINDTYGHVVGDEALCEMASVLMKACGKIGHDVMVARYGGDEFILMVVANDISTVRKLCDEVRNELDRFNRSGQKPYRLTVSFGGAKYKKGMSLQKLIDKADRGLYKMKRKHHEERDSQQSLSAKN